mmetsp:Transcript_3994/g.5548  ORF Transcript_3994/g.5548 Transcript_3994/m.5548 type:complete len:165 (+) Transcript_3994:371-865(+)
MIALMFFLGIFVISWFTWLGVKEAGGISTSKNQPGSFDSSYGEDDDNDQNMHIISVTISNTHSDSVENNNKDNHNINNINNSIKDSHPRHLRGLTSASIFAYPSPGSIKLSPQCFGASPGSINAPFGSCWVSDLSESPEASSCSECSLSRGVSVVTTLLHILFT